MNSKNVPNAGATTEREILSLLSRGSVSQMMPKKMHAMLIMIAED